MTIVQQHYEAGADAADPVAQVRSFLAQNPGPLSGADLAGLDQFHVRGLEATTDLVALLGLRPGMRVLDAGSGLGGPSRHVAETSGSHVTGVDLTPSFVDIATLLAERTGMAGRADYRVGNLLELDLPDAAFDVVYTQHVVMNIADRARAYGELARVLKPGGRFGFYDVLAVDGAAEALYPTPWSETAASSFLLTETATRAALAQAGLVPGAWHDVSAQALAWFASQAPLAGRGLAMIMGPRFARMSANFARNLKENRIRLVMGVSTKT
jgi:ubiquinone/menaquinone biosynthesis C-methylase UbiE